ncbi:MAG: M23 family metallopeptidase [Dethiobacteria bacterium]
MRYRQHLSRSIIPPLIIFVFSFVMFSTGCNESKYDAEPGKALFITPYFSSTTGVVKDIEIVHYPELPAPGDFLILEAGPVSEITDYEFSFDFPGVLSELYRTDGLLYAIIAISCDAEPGSYSLAVESVDAGENSAARAEKNILISDKEFNLSRFSMPPDRTAGWTAARLAEDREKVRAARETTEPHPLWMNRFIIPLEGRITSEFGAIRIINNNPPRRHSGIDIGADKDTPVVAPNNGIVRLAEFLLSGGNTVILDHGMGLSSTYMHLEAITVENGQKVERGELIGTVGMSGYATGYHLHWEVNIGQTAVNPEQLTGRDLLWVPPAYTAHFLDRD